MEVERSEELCFCVMCVVRYPSGKQHGKSALSYVGQRPDLAGHVGHLGGRQ